VNSAFEAATWLDDPPCGGVDGADSLGSDEASGTFGMLVLASPEPDALQRRHGHRIPDAHWRNRQRRPDTAAAGEMTAGTASRATPFGPGRVGAAAGRIESDIQRHLVHLQVSAASRRRTLAIYTEALTSPAAFATAHPSCWREVQTTCAALGRKNACAKVCRLAELRSPSRRGVVLPVVDMNRLVSLTLSRRARPQGRQPLPKALSVDQPWRWPKLPTRWRTGHRGARPVALELLYGCACVSPSCVG